MSNQSSDKKLVKRVQRGDKGAFDLLVLKYQHKIVNLVMRYVRDPDLALDITQEAFIKAYRALPRFRGDSAFYTWMYRIAVNTAKNHLAAQRRRPMNVELDFQDPDQYDLHAKLKETDTPEAITLSNELKSTVEQAIAALPEDLRTAIILREIEGMSYEEIAQTMECPVGTVRSRIFRARDAIGKKIGSLTR
ncbi:MAG: RNA polymerase sigma factor RpoE [Gammaproteobacteria bacterium]|nr:RNA polymerase sigma factor RpoE [Gammaproteobacteria bacterium]